MLPRAKETCNVLMNIIGVPGIYHLLQNVESSVFWHDTSSFSFNIITHIQKRMEFVLCLCSWVAELKDHILQDCPGYQTLIYNRINPSDLDLWKCLNLHQLLRMFTVSGHSIESEHWLVSPLGVFPALARDTRDWAWMRLSACKARSLAELQPLHEKGRVS